MRPAILAGAGLTAAAAVSSLTVYAVRRWAARHGIVDRPNERSSHTAITPRGGGLAIVGVTVAGSMVAAAWDPNAIGSPLLLLMLGGILVAAVSWLDDLRGLSTTTRLLAHVAAAWVALACVGPFTALAVPPLGVLSLGWLGWLLTAMWIVGLTNAYNFMDGIDGLAAGQAVVAGVGWMLLGGLGAPSAVTVGGAVLAASSAGFLVHNWPPARIFMGDVGSAFLGYALASLTVVAARAEPADALAGALLVWPFVFDASFTFVRRLARGENVLTAHRSHLYQRLVLTGLSHGAVSALYIGLAALGLALAVGLRGGSALATATWLPAVAIAALLLVTATRHRERLAAGRRGIA